MNGPHLLLAALVAASVGCHGASTAEETQTHSAAAAPQDGAQRASTQPFAGSANAPLADDPRSGAESIVETTFDDVKFPMEKSDTFAESMLTDRVRALFGKRIRIRGYMYPTLRKRGLKQFVLVRDNLECCFGPGAALFDCVLVTMAGDATAEYSIRPIAVEGTFRFEPLEGPDGRPMAIYQMAGEAVAAGG